MNIYIFFSLIVLMIPLNAAQPQSDPCQPSKYITLVASNDFYAYVREDISNILLKLLGKKISDKINCLRFASISSKELEDTLVSIQNSQTEDTDLLQKKISDNEKWQDCLETVTGKSYTIEDFLVDPIDLTILKRFNGFTLNLSYLSLANTTGLIRIDCVDRLKVLDLSHNNLTRLKAHAFSPLKGLQQLVLHDNNIEQVDPDAFEGLVCLKTLLMKNNCLDDSCLPALTKLTSLNYLELDHNPNISGINEPLINALSRLTTLTLNITRVPIDKREHLNSIARQRSTQGPSLSVDALRTQDRKESSQRKSNWFEKFVGNFK